MSAPYPEATFQAVETIISYHFTDKTLLRKALQAAGSIASICNTGGVLDTDGNKRPAIVGDVVLKLVLVEEWYRLNTPRAHADAIVKEVASNENLDTVGKRLGLDRYVEVAPGMRGIQVPWRTMAATMEAMIWAVYVDGGIEAVKQVMRTMGLVAASSPHTATSV
ncbi:hypothetical protein ACLMJK_001692 [Lecanora helva]